MRIDFNYKQTAIETTYDIESMCDLFTIASINDGGLRLILFGNDQFVDMTHEKLINQMKRFASHNKDLLEDLLEKSIEDLTFDARIYNTNNPKMFNRLLDDLRVMIHCEVFDTDRELAKILGQRQPFSEYVGWNSAYYDLYMLVVCYLWLSYKRENTTPADFRMLSDILINADVPPFLLGQHVQEKTRGLISKSAFHTTLNMALYRDGHIDAAKLIPNSTDTESTDRILPPALKREMGKFGLDIIIDGDVASSEPKEWTDEDKESLVDYNFNDVLGTRFISNRGLVQSNLNARDNLFERYPYTSARSTPIKKLNVWKPTPRDETMPTLASLVVLGERRQKPEDNLEVSYVFPLPDGKGGLEEKDLLDYIKETEDFMHDYQYTFFNHFRGKDTRAWEDDYKVKKSQPITHSQFINIPLFRDGKSTSAYVTSSTGGSHGGTDTSLDGMTMEEVNAWIVTNKPLDGKYKPTVDVKNVIHLDFASFYPAMSDKLGIYRLKNGQDYYKGVMEERLKVKALLPFDKSTWDEEDVKNDEMQTAYKTAINSTTGAGNTHKEHALLPVDNKILSMRLIGNMLIWTLAQRLTQAGAYVISVNTDGIYCVGISLDEAHEITNKYIEDYGVEIEPEVIDRLINKDVSNRIEYVGKNRQSVSGELKHGARLGFTDRSLGANVKYPLIIASSVLEYMDDEDWLKTPYDKERLRSIIESKISKENLQALYHVHIGTRKNILYYDDEDQQKINRIILTKDGKDLLRKRDAFLTTDEMRDLWNHHLYSFSVKNLKKLGDQEEIEWVEPMSIKTSLSDLIAMRKVKKGKVEYYLEVPLKKEKYDVSEWKKVKAKLGFSHLGLKSQANIEVVEGEERLFDIEPISTWKVGVLSGYPENPKGVILNMREDLENFDVDEIDLDQYLDWAENVLATWKISGDIPEIGSYSIDDTIKPKAKRKLTIREKAISKVSEIYESILEKAR